MNDITALAQQLRATAEKANEHGEFNMAMHTVQVLALVEALEKAHLDISSANRMMKAQDQELITRRQRIASLESRTVTVKLPEAYGYLRENDGQIQISIGAVRPSDRSGGYATPWFAIYTAAGIQVIEGEQKNG